MTTYYDNGERYFYDIKGLIEYEPTYRNTEKNVEINFFNWDDKRVEIVVMTNDWKHDIIEEKITSSLKVVNKTIKKYGLQFTDLAEI